MKILGDFIDFDYIFEYLFDFSAKFFTKQYKYEMEVINLVFHIKNKYDLN